MAGKGNAGPIFPAVAQAIMDPRWKDCFKDFQFPYGFFTDAQYRGWLMGAGLKPVRVDSFPRMMPGTEEQDCRVGHPDAFD